MPGSIPSMLVVGVPLPNEHASMPFGSGAHQAVQSADWDTDSAPDPSHTSLPCLMPAPTLAPGTGAHH